MAIGDRIRLRREEKGLSAVELANAAGISKGYLSEIETGRSTKPSGAVLLRIAQELGTTIADLLEEHVRALPRTISKELREFADRAKLPEEDVEMLAQIRFRGDQPKSNEDWAFLYESIRRSMPRRRGRS